jgi:hypothetical protein
MPPLPRRGAVGHAARRGMSRPAAAPRDRRMAAYGRSGCERTCVFTRHDGTPFTANDIGATFEQLCGPKTGSAAASPFKGRLSPGGAQARGSHTVEFPLDTPNGHSPYDVSSDNDNAAIVPAHVVARQRWPKSHWACSKIRSARKRRADRCAGAALYREAARATGQSHLE